MFQYSYHKHVLQFSFEARTSRGAMHEHPVYFIRVHRNVNTSCVGIGEAAPIRGLSIDSRDDFETNLHAFLDVLNSGISWKELDLTAFPSIRFALETAHADLENGGKCQPYPSPFIQGNPIAINGLVWMSDLDSMLQSFEEKVQAGFDVLKLKIGSHDFDAECRLLETLRKSYLPSRIAIRLDANGAFHPKDAKHQLQELQRFHIHSIEQPIQPKQWEDMARLCADSPIPIALDEELIGCSLEHDAAELMRVIRPQYIILKPTLIGGIAPSEAWIRLCENVQAGWWATSALESNIGLNAISQWVSCKNSALAQGLGTGQLYSNNISSPLEVKQGNLYFNSQKSWKLPDF